MAKTHFATYLWGTAARACWWLSGIFEGLALYCDGEGTLKDALSLPRWRRDSAEFLRRYADKL